MKPSLGHNTEMSNAVSSFSNGIKTNGASFAGFTFSAAPNPSAPVAAPLSLNSLVHVGTTSALDADSQEKAQHLGLIDASSESGLTENARFQEIITAPLFSRAVSAALRKGQVSVNPSLVGSVGVFPQYGFIGVRQASYDGSSDAFRLADDGSVKEEDMVYANMNAPWSAFVCGSQGGGKSHTLSCLLENSLLTSSVAGVLPNPLTGIVFHYDKFTSHTSTQLCEAAYLCSSGVPVCVLVSPSNYWTIEKLYANLPGLPASAPRPKVIPLYLQEWQLNVTNMITLMAINTEGSFTPLYLEVLFQILRDMAMERRGAPGLDYSDFKRRLEIAPFSKDQNAPLRMRLQLLESFLAPGPKDKSSKPRMSDENIWKFGAGSLTIVDLSCPFVNENDACALFSICLSLFLENRTEGGRIVALDEAHKFLTQSGEAMKFTDQLTSIICQQRHLATRVIIATQEPTLSPRLLDLCNVTIVHRFLSPAWFSTLKGHLAGAGGTRSNAGEKAADIFKMIVGLKTGEALVFCPTAILDVLPGDPDNGSSKLIPCELKDAYIKLRIRKRLTADGGKSILASERSHGVVNGLGAARVRTNGC